MTAKAHPVSKHCMLHAVPDSPAAVRLMRLSWTHHALPSDARQKCCPTVRYGGASRSDAAAQACLDYVRSLPGVRFRTGKIVAAGVSAGGLMSIPVVSRYSVFTHAMLFHSRCHRPWWLAHCSSGAAALALHQKDAVAWPSATLWPAQHCIVVHLISRAGLAPLFLDLAWGSRIGRLSRRLSPAVLPHMQLSKAFNILQEGLLRSPSSTIIRKH